jgi:cyclohexanecarboxyl-CoA dehydrogenase
VEIGFSPEEETFRDFVRTFAAREFAASYRSDDAMERFGKGIDKAMVTIADAGLAGLRIPEEYGGQGADCVSVGIAFEELSKANINATYLASAPIIVSEVINQAGTDEQRARFLPALAAGRHIPSFAMTEPNHGSDAASLQLRAARISGGWSLSGEKTSISLAPWTDISLVFARTGGDGSRGITAFIVELDDDHVEKTQFRDLGSRAIGRGSLFFDDHFVPHDNVLGGVGGGFGAAMRGFDYNRAAIGLMCVGAAQGAVDEALNNARQRVAFGQPLGKNQGVAFPLAEHVTKLRAARLLSYDALRRRDLELPHSTEAAMVKWWVPKTCVEIIHECVLLLGHQGFTDEYTAAQRLRDVMSFEMADGPAQIMKLIIARDILGRAYAP